MLIVRALLSGRAETRAPYRIAGSAASRQQFEVSVIDDSVHCNRLLRAS